MYQKFCVFLQAIIIFVFMGWDIVEIGLKHDLPINKPLEVAEIVSKRMGMNVRLYTQEFFVYNEDNHSVSDVEEYKEIELGYFKINDSDNHIEMNACHYQALQFIEMLGEKRYRTLKYNDRQVKDYFKVWLPPFEYYELDYHGEAGKDFNARIFKENIDLDVFVNTNGRWSTYNYYLKHIDECRDILTEYREELHKRAKIFGCHQIIITCDQGPTTLIFDSINLTSDELQEYVNSKKYVENDIEYMNRKDQIIHYNFQALLNKKEAFDTDLLWGAVFDTVE